MYDTLPVQGFRCAFNEPVRELWQQIVRHSRSASDGGVAVRVMVTGASGFVGRHVAAELARAGFVLTLVGGTRVPSIPSEPGTSSNLHQAHAVGDMSDCDLSLLLNGCDAVVHAAGRAHVFKDTSTDVKTAYHRANAEAVARLCAAMAQANVRRLVLISSIAAQLMISAYGRSKRAGEDIALAHPDIDVVALRPPLIYGPGGPGNLGRLIGLIRRGLPLPFASVDNRRSLCAISNIAQLVCQILKTPQPQTGVYEVCDSTPVSLPQIVHTLARGLGRPARLVPFPTVMLALGVGVLSRSISESLFGNLVLDAAAASKAFDWTPTVETLQGLEDVGAFAKITSAHAPVAE